MLLAEVVAVSNAVSETRSKTAKVEALTGLLRRLEPDEIVVAVGFLVGTVRPGRVGIGWATLREIDVPPASTPGLTVHDVDRAIADVATTTGAGSVAHAAIVSLSCSVARPRPRPASSGDSCSASCARARSKA